MAQKRTIVGLGELVLVEEEDDSSAGGLAAEIAIAAAALDHAGVAVSRVGQDQAGDRVCALLAERGVEIAHVQRDPDLPTARRSSVIGKRSTQSPRARAAFDELRWDFDLEDLAQRADAVIYGPLSRRGGQTRAEEDRFLDHCTRAIKLFDLTNRGDETQERGPLLAALERADAAILDADAASLIFPGQRELSMDAAAERLLNEMKLSLAFTVERDADDAVRFAAHLRDDSAEAVIARGRSAQAAATAKVLLALIRGDDMQTLATLLARDDSNASMKRA